jgi:hypothetical protein
VPTKGPLAPDRCASPGPGRAPANARGWAARGGGSCRFPPLAPDTRYGRSKAPGRWVPAEQWARGSAESGNGSGTAPACAAAPARPVAETGSRSSRDGRVGRMGRVRRIRRNSFGSKIPAGRIPAPATSRGRSPGGWVSVRRRKAGSCSHQVVRRSRNRVPAPGRRALAVEIAGRWPTPSHRNRRARHPAARPGTPRTGSITDRPCEIW